MTFGGWIGLSIGALVSLALTFTLHPGNLGAFLLGMLCGFLGMMLGSLALDD